MDVDDTGKTLYFGEVKFVHGRGFAFLWPGPYQGFAEGTELYFHLTQWIGPPSRLLVGQRCSFMVGHNGKGLCALRVLPA